MKNHLRLLIITESPPLVSDLSSELHKKGIEAEWEMTPLGTPLQGHLTCVDWDAIIVDDDLLEGNDSFVGYEMKGREEALPIILVVRKNREEAVLISMGSDFQDYVLRENLNRFPFLLDREIRAASLRRQLRQAQKLEAIGVLAGGIAHDFNNILAAIIGYTELSREELPEESPLRPNLDQILRAGLRAKDLVQQILACSRQMESERRPLPLQLIVKETLKLLRSSLPSTIQIRTQINEQCGMVMADPAQIHQVIMNLCTNAYHAMRERGGVLTVGLEESFGGNSVHPSQAGFLNKAYILMTVSDSGHGMDSKTLARIFEPCFTTKPPHEGTGMGLMMVQNIVKGHGGVIQVQSEPDKGTTFRLYFPQWEQPAQSAIVDSAPLPHGRGHILFVDDEEQIVHSNRQMLERLGYEVTGMSSSLAALAAFRARPGEYHLVITDLTMPRLTGLELTQEIRQIRPDVPVVLCTGFSERATPELIRELEINAFLTKPVTSREMAQLLYKILRTDSSSP